MEKFPRYVIIIAINLVLIQEKGVVNVKKRILSLFTSLVMVISLSGILPAMTAGAAKSGDYEYEILDDGTVEITDYTGSATSLTIPSTIDGKKVTSIAYSAFYNRDSLTSVTIPDSVTSIGDWAFYDCESLTNVTIPDSITSMGCWVFSGTPFLENQTTDVKYAGKWVIDCDGDATSVSIKSGTIGIAYSAFCNRDSLTSVTIPNSVTSIGDYAFESCDSLTSITIPNSVTSIGWGAFFYCESLTNITIPDSIISMGGGAFDGTPFLENQTTDVKYAGKWIIDCDENAKSVTLKDNTIGIADGAFGYCESLTSFNVDSNNKNYSSQDGVLFNKDKTEIILYPKGNSRTSYTIPNSVTTIGEDAFAGNKILKKITIPNSVIKIDDGAFSDCWELNNVTIPDSVTSIGDGAFGYCYSLTDIKISNSITSIGAYAFAYGNFTEISIPDGVTSIGVGAFNSSSLTSVIIPKSVKFIDVAAFACDLTDVYYTGTEAEWNKIVIKEDGNHFADAKIHYNYSRNSPANITKVSFTTSANAVKMSWSKVNGATGYIVYKYDTTAKSYKRVATTKSTSYTFSKLASGTTYKFTVRAYKTYGGKNYLSPKYTNFTTTTNPATVNFKLTAGSKKATVSWNKVNGATGYIVYYKTSANGIWQRLKTTTGTSYTKTGLTKGKTYYFTVKAYRTVNGNTYNGSFTTKSVKVK